MKNLKQELIEILTYFNDGLMDVESGSGEEQPMQKRIEIALRKVKNLTIPDVSILYCDCVFPKPYASDNSICKKCKGKI